MPGCALPNDPRVIVRPLSDIFLTSCPAFLSAAPYSGECEDPYPSLSDYHDYEPNLEFDDSDLHQKHPEGPDGEFGPKAPFCKLQRG